MADLVPHNSALTPTHLGIGLALLLTGGVYALGNFHFRSLSRYFFAKPTDDGYRLDFSPTEIGWVDRIFLLLFGVLYKSIRGLFVPGLRVKARETIELPRLEIRCPVQLLPEHEQLYIQAVSTEKSNRVEGMTKEFLLAAITNQLMLLLVVHPRLPISPLGGVNVRNRIEFPSSSSRKEPSTLTAHAYVGGKDNLARIVKRGIEFDIHIDVFSDKQPVLHQILTILTPCKTSSTSSTHPLDPLSPNSPSIGQISMETSSPFQWSRVCGDYNPVHVSALLAKLFGFPGKIAHGNHVVATMLHLLDTSDRGQMVQGQAGKGWWIEMHFQRPMVLPIRLEVQIQQGDVQRWQCVRQDAQAKVYVSGSIGRI